LVKLVEAVKSVKSGKSVESGGVPLGSGS